MSERLSITPLGPYIGAQISGADLTRPLSDNQFEQLYHAVLRHQVVFLRDQAITPQQQRALAWQRSATSRKVWLLIVSGAKTARQLAIMVVMLLVIAKPRSCVSAGISQRLYESVDYFVLPALTGHPVEGRQ